MEAPASRTWIWTYLVERWHWNCCVADGRVWTPASRPRTAELADGRRPDVDRETSWDGSVDWWFGSDEIMMTTMMMMVMSVWRTLWSAASAQRGTYRLPRPPDRYYCITDTQRTMLFTYRNTRCPIKSGLPGISYHDLFVPSRFAPWAFLTLILTLTVILHNSNTNI